MKKKRCDFLSLYVDGAARGNPGPAGVGIILEDENKRIVANIDKFIGNATNNVAEYTALITGMEEARKLGAKAITINTDSQLLAKQLSGEYRVKNPVLKELHEQARKALIHFDRVIVNNIPREQNKGADKLANKAIDGSASQRNDKSFVLK
ncbi:MAG: ribonuclease HI family protein [Candidatus Omnitrophota bacterium]|jgi:ribonuclease HI